MAVMGHVGTSAIGWGHGRRNGMRSDAVKACRCARGEGEWGEGRRGTGGLKRKTPVVTGDGGVRGVWETLDKCRL